MDGLDSLLDTGDTKPTATKSFLGTLQRSRSLLPTNSRKPDVFTENKPGQVLFNNVTSEKSAIKVDEEINAFTNFGGTGTNFGVKQEPKVEIDQFAKSDYFSNLNTGQTIGEFKRSTSTVTTSTGLLGNYSRRRSDNRLVQVTPMLGVNEKEEHSTNNLAEFKPRSNLSINNEEEMSTANLASNPLLTNQSSSPNNTSNVPLFTRTRSRFLTSVSEAGSRSVSNDRESSPLNVSVEKVPEENANLAQDVKAKTNLSFNRPLSPEIVREPEDDNNLSKSKSTPTGHFISKQDSNMSFRGNKQESDSNIISPSKNKVDSEYSEAQIATLKRQLQDEKERFDTLLKEEREMLKRKETDNAKYIEELKLRHKSELLSYEQNFKSREQALNEDIKRLRSELDKEILNERERIQLLHKSELETQENNFKRQLEQCKKTYDDQNETLKKQLQQQIEFNRLASKVEMSSKQIEDLLLKFESEKNKSFDNEKSTLETREKHLQDLEEKLNENEKIFNMEKENFNKSRKDFEFRELEKKKELHEERQRIEKEILRLQDLQTSLKLIEYESKEKYERERLEINQKHTEMKIEIETIKTEYNQKLNDLEHQKKLFEEEKKYFEKYKEEAVKNIEIKKTNFEERRKQFYEEEREIKGRIKILQEKEFYFTEKYDEFERVNKELEDKEKKIERDRRELMLAARRIEEGIKSLDEKNRIVEREKEEVMKRFNEIENEKAILNSERLKIEQEKTELRIRLQSVDMMRIKYVSSSLNQPNQDYRTTCSPFNPSASMPSFVPETKANFYNTVKNKTNYNPIDVRQSNNLSQTSLRKSINAEEYFNNVKSRLGMNESKLMHSTDAKPYLSSNYYNPEEYLRKSNEITEIGMKNMHDKNYISEISLINDKVTSNYNTENYFTEKNKPNLEKTNNPSESKTKKLETSANNTTAPGVKPIHKTETKKNYFDEFDEVIPDIPINHTDTVNRKEVDERIDDFDY